nr:hypothetical protein BaRGS_032410 [Batillaria attramentaria]
MAGLRSILPSYDNFKAAKQSLIRLQQTYHLNVIDMYAGDYLGHRGPPLTPPDAIQFGMQAFTAHDLELCRQWLDLAEEKMREQKDDNPDAFDFDALRKELSGEISHFVNTTEYQTSSELNKLCSRDKEHRVEEILSHRPYVSLFYDMVTDNQARALKTAAKDKVVNYGTGGHYDTHWDPWGGVDVDKAMQSIFGNRIASFLIYNLSNLRHNNDRNNNEDDNDYDIDDSDDDNDKNCDNNYDYDDIDNNDNVDDDMDNDDDNDENTQLLR